MQRKEPWPVPFLVTLGAALLGGIWALLSAVNTVAARRKSGQQVKHRVLPIVTSIGGGIIATGAVYTSSYLEPDTFVASFEALFPLFIAAAAAAYGGAKVGAVGAFRIENIRAKSRGPGG
jgi:hypothetical protein